MTEIAYVEIDPDFEPLSRPRSCTWPLPRPEFDEPTSSNTSSPAPSVKQEPGGNTDLASNINLLAQTEDYAEQKTPVMCNDFQCQETCVHPHSHGRPHNPPLPTPGLTLHHQQQVAPGVNSLTTAQRKTSSSRRNAWGNMSYADLITKAIDSSPEKRLTLSQIYDWMVKSVPYFKDKGDSNSSAGWKNSIRHNLSLHSRFVRMQNEGTGKSSWWMLNPDGGKNGKSPRRRAASMDNNSKFTKSRGRAARKKVTLQEGMEHTAGSPGSQYTKWLGSPNSHSNDDFETWSSFRTRTSSNASTLSGRHSPFLSEQDDLAEADVHMGYSGGPGAKITGTLPSLSEVGGSMGRRGPENLMENLLDNLNLLSPKNPQRRSDSPNSSTPSLLRSSPYSHPSMAHQPQQDYSKCLYGQQQQMSSVSPVPMRTVPDGKPGYGSFETHYSRPPGLLDDLLASGGDLHGDMMAAAAAEARAGRGQCLPPSYGSHGHHVDHMCAQVMSRHVHTSSSQAPNGCGMVPLTSLARTPHRMNSLRTGMQMPQGHQTHPRARAPPSYGSLNGSRHPPHPYHSHHHERLPSDLDNVSIEGFECDMESVLHDTLMDGDALDFNFDPTAGLHGFPQRLKPNNHSWVSS